MKKYINSELKRINKINKLRYMSIKESTSLAKKEVDLRLKGMNEFRQALKDSNDTFITRNEYCIQHEKVAEDIKFLRESRANLEGKASMTSVYISYGIAILALVIAALKFFI